MILNKNTNIKPGYFIFYYHDISDNQLIPNNVRTSPERFKKEILFFLNNFEVVSLEKQINLIKKERVATYPTCSICFDDGYLSVLKFAHPFLIKHKIHHTLFLNSEIISNKNMEQISNPDLLEDVTKKILEMHQKEVQDYKNGKNKLLGFFVGQIMKETKGKANPKILNQVLNKLLKGE